jgi:hypothetical protein
MARELERNLVPLAHVLPFFRGAQSSDLDVGPRQPDAGHGWASRVTRTRPRDCAEWCAVARAQEIPTRYVGALASSGIGSFEYQASR